MRKFFAVLKREYFKVVWTKVFILTTLLAPVGMVAVSVIPVLMFSIKGNAVRLAVADVDSQLSGRLAENLSAEKQAEKIRKNAEDSLKQINASQEEALKRNAEQFGGSFDVRHFSTVGKTGDEVRNELNRQIAAKEIDSYLIIPPDVDAADAKFEFYARNASDFVSKTSIENAVNDAVRLGRLEKVNITSDKLRQINKKVSFSVKSVDERGSVKEGNDFGFFIAFGLAFLLYVTITMYGSAVLGAVVEEKETKIAEILFSSARPFELMMGKLTGVCLAGLTQIGIWVGSAALIAGYTLFAMNSGESLWAVTNITPSVIVYFFVFFLTGFFLYSTIYALIGSMVTTTQEAGQFVLVTVIILMAGLYSVIPIVRDPNSTFSVIVSFVPFISPISMPVRIFTETPPFWQIAISLLLNVLTTCAFVWAAARVYRVGMLMYGKRATIPEVWRWIRQG